MNIVWYLVIFGLDWNSSQTIPQASREQCLRSVSWYEGRIQSSDYMRPHAFCFEGVAK